MMTSAPIAVLYGLAGAIAWGAADFNGGLASRKGRVLAVVLFCQIIGGVALLLAALSISEPLPPVSHLLYGGLAGSFGIIGLVALYHGLSTGRMGIVAPLSAVLTALVPVGYTLFHLGLPSLPKMAGFACFVVAVWLLSSGDIAFRMTLNELLISLFSGLTFGMFFILIDKANDVAVFWPLVTARLFSITLLLLVILFTKKKATPVSGQWTFIILGGLLDACGNCLFSMAARAGRLDVAAVLGSLYPAATVLLAFVFLKERLLPMQWVGVAAAFVSLVLISI